MAFGYDGSIRIDTNVNSRGFNKGISSMSQALRGLAGVIGAAFGVAAIVNFGRESVKAASRLSSALIGLQSIVEGQGRSFQKAQGFIDDYIKDGLVPMQDAVTAYKNLAMRGYSTEQIEKTMVALKDASAFGRNASMSMGDAVSSASEGLKNENSLLVDNAGVTKNVAKMWDDYAKSIGTTANKLTQQQKIQAEVNGILEESRYQVGDAEKVAGTYAGQIAVLSFNFEKLKVAIGNAIMPIVQAVLPGINSIISALTTLANVFAQVTSLLFGGGGMKEQEKTQTGIASSAGAAAGATDDLASATGGMGDASKKAAKDMKGVTAGFDDLNVLASSAADSLDSAAGAVGGLEAPDLAGGDVGQMWGDVEINPEIAAFVDGLKDSLARLNKALGPTKQALAGLWEQLEIAGGFAWDGLRLFYDNFLVPIGEWAMSEEGLPRLIRLFDETLQNINWEKINASLGALWTELSKVATFTGNALIDFYEYFLKPIAEWTMNEAIPRFVDALTNGLAAVDWEKIRGGLIELWKALAPFAVNVGEGLLWLWENVLVPFGTWVMNEVVSRFLEILALAITGLNGIIELVKPAIQWLWDNFLLPVAKWTGGVILTVIDGLIGLLKILVGLITGDFELAMEGAEDVLESVTSLFNQLREGAIAAWEKIKEVWSAASGWLNTNVVEPITEFFSGLWSSISTWASEAWDSIVSVFQDAADWFNEHIIDPITRGFKGFVNGLIGYVEGFINFFVRGINKIIDAVNSLSLDIPDILGGGTIGFNLPNVAEIALPRLANGAVIPPNQQFAAILGDQTHGRNFEAPESLLRQIVREEMSGAAGGSFTVEMPVYLDGREVYRNQQTVSTQMGKSFTKRF